MTKFLLKCAATGIFVLTIHLLIAHLADGKWDPYYLRFTTPKQPSLIVGASRAAQGLKPSVLNAAWRDRGVALPTFNFSFTLTHSPYGPVYLRAIEKKLDTASAGGIHIVSVSPWSIYSTSATPDLPSSFREKGQILDRVRRVNGTHPNLDYFLHFNRGWGRMLTARIDFALTGAKQLHRDGWLEITVPMNGHSAQKRMAGKARRYRNNLSKYRFSRTRLSYLKKTLAFLKDHGQVYLVRIPVASPILEIENQLSRTFDQTMQSAADGLGVPYLNHMDDREEYRYTDGNPLYKRSSEKFTAKLAREIIDKGIGAGH